MSGQREARIAFLGSGAFGIPSLEMIARTWGVSLVVSQPDRPAGRGKVETPTPIAGWATARGVPMVRADDVNGSEVLARLAALGVNVLAIIAFGQKIGESVLAGRFAVNLHGSLLPRWRGAAPIQRSVMEGDAEVGVSVISIAPTMDAGVVYDEARTIVGEGETAGALHDRLSELGVEPLRRVLASWVAGDEIAGRAQDESKATRARKLSRTDAWVDFRGPARLVAARINGLSPWPGVDALVGGKHVKVLRARAIGERLEVLEVQPAGGKAMRWPDFLRGLRWDVAARGGDPPITCPTAPGVSV